MKEPKETTSQRLRQRAEDALEGSRLTEAETLLDRLCDIADGDDAIFAHRSLAEIRLERHPWRAALHLRHVLRAFPEDHVPRALMGLSQALLGNYGAAVASYRKALQIAPAMPSYLHNLGHLLDIALDRPRAAQAPLCKAAELAPEHDEILASLAHCRARLGALDDALELSRSALALAPRNAHHGHLVRWIEAGAPDDWDEPRIARPRSNQPTGDLVQQSFERGLSVAGFLREEIGNARILWADFRECCEHRVLTARKPEVFAAAVHYAIVVVYRHRGMTKASVARRYRITPGSLARRYQELCDALTLVPGDPRYTSP